jgi:hypothetical protein
MKDKKIVQYEIIESFTSSKMFTKIARVLESVEVKWEYFMFIAWNNYLDGDMFQRRDARKTPQKGTKKRSNMRCHTYVVPTMRRITHYSQK